MITLGRNEVLLLQPINKGKNVINKIQENIKSHEYQGDDHAVH